MTWHTVQCGYAAYIGATVSVESETPEEACAAAIKEADNSERWTSTDHASDAFVSAMCEGADGHPWNGPLSALPLPDRFTERGAPPVVTLTGARPPGGVEISGGTVRIRFATSDPAKGTATTEISDPPPPPGNKPLVTIEPSPGGAPDVTAMERSPQRKLW